MSRARGGTTSAQDPLQLSKYYTSLQNPLKAPFFYRLTRAVTFLLCSYRTFSLPCLGAFLWPLCGFPTHNDELLKTFRTFRMVQWASLFPSTYLDSRIANSPVALIFRPHIRPYFKGSYFLVVNACWWLCSVTLRTPYHTYLSSLCSHVISALASDPEAIHYF